jgi:polyisoprenoid-binding protein YceI
MNTHKLPALLGIVLSLAGAPVSAENTTQAAASTTQTEWSVDPTHTHVGFSVPHMVVSEVEGEFRTFTGKVLLDEKNPSNSQVDFTAQVNSIDTGNADRDKHLKTGDFFDAEKYPQLTFKSVAISKAGKGYKVTGDLTIRGVTKRVTLDASLSESITNPWGKQVRAVKLHGVISRADFGVSWNKALDKGGVVVGDKVDLNVKAELNK